MSSGFKTLGDTLGWFGTCFSIIFYMAPAQPYSRFIRKEVTLNDVPALLLLFSYLNCVSWIAYGLRDEQAKPFVCNLVGATLSLVFIILFFAFYVNLNVKKGLLITIIIFNLTAEFYYVCHFVIKSVKTLGLICMAFNILMYAGTLEKFTRIIKSHNYNLIPILSATLMFINGACWTIYGFAYNDINIIIANVSGVVLEALAIGMWCFLRKKYPEAGEIEVVQSHCQSQDEKPQIETNSNVKLKPQDTNIKNNNDKKNETKNIENNINNNNINNKNGYEHKKGESVVTDTNLI